MTAFRAGPLLGAVVALYAAGIAAIWYLLTDEWEYAAAAGVPLNLILGFAIGRWWAPLLAALALPVALPDPGGVEGAAPWELAGLFLALPGAAFILAGVLLSAAFRRRQLG